MIAAYASALRASAGCGLALMVLATSGAAQFAASAPTDTRFVSLTLERPFHPDAFDLNTVLGHVAYGTPLGPRITGVGGISLVHARDVGRPSSTIVSNLWVDLNFGAGGDGFVTLTITLPTAERLVNEDSYAVDAGIAADIQHPERFTRRTTGVALKVTPRWRIGRATAGVRGGFAAISPSGTTRELYVRFGAFGEIELPRIRAGVDATGAWFLNPRGVNRDRTIGELTTAQADVFVGLVQLPLRPHFFVRVPVDGDARRRLRALFGVRLTG